MATLTNDQVSLEYSDGKAQRTTLYVLKNVDAGDIYDLAGQFKVVKRAGIVSATGTTIAAISTISSGTVITIPAGPLDDAIWLIVVGVSA